MRKRIKVWALALVPAVLSCSTPEDTRYFAPVVTFGSSTYDVSSKDGGMDVELVLSRPASQDLTVGLIVSSSLEEGVQYSYPGSKVNISAGQQGAKIHFTLMDDQIWVENSWIQILLAPGQRYTVNPDQSASTRVNVSKVIEMPIFHLVPPEDGLTVNPYLAPVMEFRLAGDRPAPENLDISLDVTGLELGMDYEIVGSSTKGFVFPSGATEHSFGLKILKKDKAGYDAQATLSILPKGGKYSVNPEEASVALHLEDPVVDFGWFLRTAAQNGGQGFQVRQGIKKKDGEWDGNTNVDLGESVSGSNYLRCYRNMFQHPSFGCLATASVSQFLRMSDLFPNYLYPNTTAILDYGNDQGHRQFSPADSLMRFVMDPGETAKGKIYLEKPRSFKAYIGSYSAWQEKVGAYAAWVQDSKDNAGNIDASTNAAIEGAISVTLERLEGTFDFSTSASASLLVTAWLRSGSDQFMKADPVNGKDPASTYDVTEEDGLWKIQYRLWPR